MKYLVFMIFFIVNNSFAFAGNNAEGSKFGFDSRVYITDRGAYFYVTGSAAKAIYESMSTPLNDTRYNGQKNGEILRSANGVDCKRQISYLSENYFCQFNLNH